MKKNFKNWAVANATMLVAVVIFAVATAVVTKIFGGDFFKNGFALGLIGICASVWYYAASKRAPFIMKVIATVASLMVAIVIYGMYFVI